MIYDDSWWVMVMYGCSSTIDPSPKWQLTGAGCASMSRGMGKDLNIAESTDTGHVSTMLFCGVTKFNQMLTFADPNSSLKSCWMTPFILSNQGSCSATARSQCAFSADARKENASSCSFSRCICFSREWWICHWPTAVMQLLKLNSSALTCCCRILAWTSKMNYLPVEYIKKIIICQHLYVFIICVSNPIGHCPRVFLPAPFWSSNPPGKSSCQEVHSFWPFLSLFKDANAAVQSHHCRLCQRSPQSSQHLGIDVAMDHSPVTLETTPDPQNSTENQLE